MRSNLSTLEAVDEASATKLRFTLAYVLPTLVVLVAAFWPLIQGGRTLYFRDVLNTHLEMKWFQAEAMRDGYLPLVDIYRSGGQTHVGNPNTVALHPDNLLYLIADPVWAMNAHFWVHVLLAPFALFWLGRAWGLRREAAWAGGVVYAVNGYILSCLNLYNLIAPAVWAPMLAASFLQLTAGRRPVVGLGIAAVVWAIVVVAGDPITAVVALALAFAAVVARGGARWRDWGRLALAVCLGTMLAAPMVLEFVQLLSLSYRGHWGFSPRAATAGSWHPARVLDWFLPLAFGSPNLLFWGHRFHAGFQPLLFSLSPGVIAMALAARGIGRERLAVWAGGSVVLGLFVAIGRGNPIVEALLTLPGAGLLRMPVKFWLLVAVGGSMLAALGIEKTLADDRPGALTRILGAFACLYGALWIGLLLTATRVELLIREWMPEALPQGLAAAERLRWTGLALVSLLFCVLLVIVVRVSRKRVMVAVPILLVLHLLSQMFFLRPLIETDDVAPYRQPSPAEQWIPEGARVVHGNAGKLFDENTISLRSYPDASARWLHREMFREFQPAAGMMAGRFFDFTLSPEGLDSFLTRATVQAIERLDDMARVRLLAAAGVEWLLLKRDLEADVVASGLAELAGTFPGVGEAEVRVYRLPLRAEEAQFVGTLHSSENLNEALAIVLDPGFDPRSEAVLAGEVEAGSGLGGRVAEILSEPERMEWKVDSEGRGALLVQRSHLPLYRAAVDGKRVPVYVANLHRMAILVEPGSHTVELRVDRSRFRAGVGLAFAALLVLIGAGVWEGLKRRHAGDLKQGER